MIGILCTHWEEGLRSYQGLCPFPMSYRRVIHLPSLYDYSCSYGYNVSAAPAFWRDVAA
jgi:hypothetical protein